MAALLDTLLDSIADGVYLVDARGRVGFVNPAGAAILGYRAADLVGRDSHATIHFKRPDGSPFPEAECPLLAPRRTGEVVRVDHDAFVRADGSLVPVAYESAPVEVDGGRGAVVVFRDIGEALERARAEEIAASRARIVAAAAEERRRLVRDLHDGAQQRLVSLLLRLRRGEIDAAAEDAQRAIDDLRALAAGIHPAVLTDRGLAAALEDLTADAPLPVILDVEERRYPPDVEAAAYFVVSEALTNVAKHAGARSARVEAHAVARGDAVAAGGNAAAVGGDAVAAGGDAAAVGGDAVAAGGKATVVGGDAVAAGGDAAAVGGDAVAAGGEIALRVTVSDDGRGGADPARGTGLRGLADRVAALGGTLTVESGHGTTLTAIFPLSA